MTGRSSTSSGGIFFGSRLAPVGEELGDEVESAQVLTDPLPQLFSSHDRPSVLMVTVTPRNALDRWL